MLTPWYASTPVSLRGLPGTGKSWRLIQQIREFSGNQQGFPFLLLTFNRRLVQKARHNHSPFLSEANALTIHALCFQVLRRLNCLPPQFTDFSDDFDIQDSQSVLLGEDFLSLLRGFVDLSSDQVRSAIGSLEMIAVDECQDLNDDLLKVVKRLRQVFADVPFIVAGDHFQLINDFGANTYKGLKPEKGDVVTRLTSQLGIDPPETLSENCRSPHLAAFLNAFLRRNTPEDLHSSYLYAEDETPGKESHPILYFCSSIPDQIRLVRELLAKSPSSVVLVRNHRSSEILEQAGISNVFRINQVKGEEFENVIFFDYSFEAGLSNQSEARVTFVGLSRAFKSLTITTSFPRENILETIDGSTVDLIEDQKPITQPYLRLPVLSDPKKNSLTRFRTSAIDSIVLSVSSNDAPFHRHVPHSGGIKRCRSMNLEVRVHQGFKYVCARHHNSGNYLFQFMDLNPLKFAGFTDAQILKFLREIIYEYFDHRLNPACIQVAKLHVAQVHSFRSLKSRRVFLNDLTHHFEQMGSSLVLYNQPFFARQKFIEEFPTGYCNLRKDRSVVIAIYDPTRKANANRICSSNSLVKVELRLNTAAAIRQKRFLGSNGTTLKSLMTHIAQEWTWAGQLLRIATQAPLPSVRSMLEPSVPATLSSRAH